MKKHAVISALIAAGALTARAPEASAQVNGGAERDGVGLRGGVSLGGGGPSTTASDRRVSSSAN